jgi:ParB-like nuclease domain
MDDLQIAWPPLDELIPYARNPRTHNDAQVAQIAASIQEFGWTNPVLVDGANGVIAGHGRVLAARKLKLERVPVIELAHMSEAQKRAYVLADIERVLGGQLADMTWTDPPYNIDYANSPKDRLRGKHRPILNDNLGTGFEAFLHDACVNIVSVTKGACYICMSSSELHTLQRAFTAARGKWSTFVIWAKNTSTLGRADYQRQYEPMLYGLEGGQRSLLVRRPRPGRRMVLR